MNTAAGQRSEDADDRAEVMMRKSLGTRPGVIAYGALALFTALAIVGSIIAIQVAKDRAKAAGEANCLTADASNRVLVEVIGELTAPRVLSPSATPEQVKAQDEANVKAAENRQAKLDKLQTVRCDTLGDSTSPEPIPVPAEPPPAVVVGPDGEIGPTGLTGLVGPTGKPGTPGAAGAAGAAGAQGTAGVVGKDGEQGKPGRDGAGGTDGQDGAPGPAGPPGPQGAPAPTTTPPTTVAPCLLGVLCPTPPRR